MGKVYNSKIDTSNFLPIVFILCFLCLGFIPNLEAVDKIAPQWLSMSILNFISGAYILFNIKSFSYNINNTIKGLLSITYTAFIFWAATSYFYAINRTEVLVNIARHFNVFLMYIHMGIFIYKIQSKAIFISYVLSSILIIEVYSVLNQAMEMINNTGFISSGSLKGVTANRNITAFSIAIKIPFVLYLIYVSKKYFFKFILALMLFGSLLGLSMIQSRAAYLAVALILVAYLILNIVLFIKNKSQKKHLFNLGYYIIPLLLAIVVNQLFVSDKGADALSRAATISFSTNDGSVNQRLRYYEDVIMHMSSNPIFGVGLGNWKLKSIEYDKADITGYIVPYHAHSDFIQLGAELGVLGFILYLGIFILTFYYAFQLIFKTSITEKEKVFIFLLLTALGIYSIDANLNFPIARPQALVVWAMLLALMNYYYNYNKKINDNQKRNSLLNLLFFISNLILLLGCLFITNSTYKSLKGQMILLQDFNSNKFSVPTNQIDYIVPDIPNITVTTIPLKSVKARYYLNAKKYDKALELLNEGTESNPYLYYSELLKSKIYTELGQMDSAYYYARTAFYNLPNNSLHSTNYVNILIQKKNINLINEAFDLLTYKNNEINWKNYLIAASNFTPVGDSVLTARAKIATEKFSGNQDFKNLYNAIAIGQVKINEATMHSNKALEYYNKGNHNLASEFFEKAVLANSLEYSYRENLATSLYIIGELQKAEQQIDIVINEMNPLNGKSEYIKALIFIKMGDPVGACPLFQTSIDSGFIQAQDLFNQYCLN